MPGFYCLDNDIIFKLATYDLFNDTLQSLDIEENHIYILDTFKYQCRKKIKRERGNKPNNIEKYDRKKALDITKNYQTISERNLIDFEQNIYTKLIDYSKLNQQGNNKIDKGEAILISYVCSLNQQENDNYLLTEDKRCLRALRNSGMTDIIERLQGRVWCLEQLILKNIEQFGFNLIQSKIYQKNNCDMNIKFIFGYSETASEDEVTELLKQEIIDLKKETRNLLYPYPDD
ncbi:hypothetical protein [Crocosphaera watsonii]|uniref:Uncharacterized protein n=1 Tax=Crocosphaera watsonii WH 8502 TaxID=423474 RepID=T2IAM7_CROWT|nr:hypothetical protein [Crocosphaera watsonii]CCQ49879.1 FIG00566212: hypothetical protein [Crocosphaera watsonii WH 8502]